MSAPHVCVTDFEEDALQILDKNALDFYRSGAGEQITLNLNREAFRRLRIRPRYLRNVSQLDTSSKILDCDIKWPVGIAPTALHKMAHGDGEAGTAKAAGEMGSIFIQSTLSTMSIEEVAQAAPLTTKWYQLYIFKDRSITEQLVRRAEKCNFKAIVLTIDQPVFGRRWADYRNNFTIPSHLRLANFENQYTQSDDLQIEKGSSGIYEYISKQFDPSLTWNIIEWLVKLTHLPIIVKGVLTAEDAILARQFGCSGIIVSNHGARQLDTVPATIEVLPEIVRAVGSDLVVMLDGGIRHGNDVFKALALGAKMVFIGRPAIWSLSSDGEDGVRNMLNVLKKDFDITMSLAGCQSMRDIKRNMVEHESNYAKL